ncbi:MAG: NAD-dependent epimerase/dehydratase family protein [Anaeromyxobacteraceae bacterium]
MQARPLRACVTGATGFLGSAVVRALAAEGAEVHGLRRRSSDAGALTGVPVAWHEGDVTDPASLRSFLEGAEWVVHAAGKLGAHGVPDRAFLEANVLGTRYVLDAALAAAPGARVLHLSSPGVLGPTADPVGEDAPYAPTNAYERSKAEAERLAIEHARRGQDVVVARPGFIYGPGDRHVLGLFQAVKRGRFFYVDGGRSLCQPTFVEDVVAGLLACLRRGRAGEAYHLVGPSAVTFRELGRTIAAALGVAAPRVSLPRWSALLVAGGLEQLASATGRRAPLTRNGVDFFSQDRVVSSSKARDEVGYAPASDVARGVPRTVAWYRDHRWL